MPKCKNDPTRRYKGDEPSPKGLGYCAHAEKIGKIKKGLDGNKWIVSETKNGTKRWIKYTKKSTDKTKKSTDKTKKSTDKTKKSTDKTKKSTKKTKKYNSVLEFYDVKTIKPANLKKYISKNKLLIKLVDKIIPEIKKNKINIFTVPLALSENDIYWSDYPLDYISEFFDSNFYNKKFIYLIIYFTKDLKINTNKNITLRYNLDIKQLQLVYDILNKHLPYQYSWDGNNQKIMEISFDKNSKKNKSIKIKKQSDYPKIFVIIWLVYKKNKKTLFDVDNPENAKELSKINDLEKTSKFMDFSYGTNDIEYVFYGINNVKYAKNLFKKLKNKGTISYDSIVFKIKKIKLYGYMTEKDAEQDNAFKL